MAGVYKEVWTREVERSLTAAESATFLDGIPDYSRYVQEGDENATIHSTKWDVRPDVLFNNTTYPMPIQNLNGTPYSIDLDKIDTTATPVTLDELYALSYDKMGEVKTSHVESLASGKVNKAIHSLAPNGNTLLTPVLVTTGATDGNRKRLVREDIVALKQAFDIAMFPIQGRRLVLSTEHVGDLLLTDQKFADQYYNYSTGKIMNLYGFEIHEYQINPFYTVSTKVKMSFGSTPNPATDRQASVAFVVRKAVKAGTKVSMQWSKAENDPLYKRNLVSFRTYFITLPGSLSYQGAIVSAAA